MNKKIEKLESEIAEKQEQIKQECFRIFEDISELKNLEDLIYKSDFYRFEPCGQLIEQVAEFDLKKYSEYSEYLSEYLSEYGIYCNFKENTISICLGHAIILNEDDNTIFDMEDDKIICDDYCEIDDLMQFINDYQEKQGVFNNVFYSDRYGYLTPFLKGEE